MRARVDSRGPRSGRIGLFLGVFALIVAVGALYQWTRPVEYSSEAVLRISAGSLQDETSLVQGYSVEDLEGLVSRGLFEKVYRHLVDRGALDAVAPAPKVDDLLAMVDASPAGGDMVRLYARGQDGQFLYELLNSWYEIYRSGRESTGEVRNESAYNEAVKRDAVLTEKLAAKRAQLETFRRDNDVVSLERGENQVLAELKQLTSALATAKEKEVEAESRMQSARESLELGIPFVLQEDQTALDALKLEASQLREQLAGLGKKYTATYMRLNPETRKMQERLANLQQSISESTEAAQRRGLEDVRRALLDARSSRVNLEQRLTEQKSKAAVFSTRHSEYQGLTEELDQLELLSREVKEKLLSMDVNEGGMETRVELVEPPYRPERAQGAFVWSDLAKLAIVALLASFLILRLFDYLAREERTSSDSPVQIFQHIGEPPRSRAGMPAPEVDLTLTQKPTEQLDRSPNLSLPHQGAAAEARELSAREVLALLRSSGEEGRLVVGLLISGLQISEIRNLRWGDLDIQEGSVEVTEGARRRLEMSPALLAYLREVEGRATSAQQRVLTHVDGYPYTDEDIEGLIAISAHDAGLDRADEVLPESIRHTYISFLVRQGVRLGELPSLVGPVPPSRMRTYTWLSPPGRGKGVDEVDTTYPLY
ncbi:MAG: tyrosine-type recombinase/integrase [Chromatiales bacterium]|nr:tyrosine-type recombinase/integrase [Chromatiales bacterium]